MHILIKCKCQWLQQKLISFSPADSASSFMLRLCIQKHNSPILCFPPFLPHRVTGEEEGGLSQEEMHKVQAELLEDHLIVLFSRFLSFLFFFALWRLSALFPTCHRSQNSPLGFSPPNCFSQTACPSAPSR